MKTIRSKFSDRKVDEEEKEEAKTLQESQQEPAAVATTNIKQTFSLFTCSYHFDFIRFAIVAVFRRRSSSVLLNFTVFLCVCVQGSAARK